jgi:hypothetical protein
MEQEGGVLDSPEAGLQGRRFKGHGGPRFLERMRKVPGLARGEGEHLQG